MDRNCKGWNLNELYKDEKEAEKILEEIRRKYSENDIQSTEQKALLEEVRKIHLYFMLLNCLYSENEYYVEMLNVSQKIYLDIYNDFQEIESDDEAVIIFEEQENLQEKYNLLLRDALEARTLEEYNDIMIYGDRESRKDLYRGVWGRIEKNKLVFSEILKKKIIIDKMEKIDGGNISENIVCRRIYNQIISVAGKVSDLYQSLLVEKSKEVNEEKLEQYDLNIDVISIRIPFDESRTTFKNALNALGKNYIDLIDEIYNSNWIDFQRTNMKVKGAYCLFVKNIHPFIIISYDDSVEAVMELIHEIGHAAKKYFSNEIDDNLIEEIPAIMNEMMLWDYLMENNDDDKKGFAVLKKEKVLKEIVRLLVEIEFLIAVHKLDETELECHTFENIWLEIQRKYFGTAVRENKYSKYGWITINWFRNTVAE